MQDYIEMIDRLISKVLPYDKCLHFMAGSIIMAAVCSIALCLGASGEASMAIGFASAVLLGCIKELLDVCMKNERADFKDIAFTALGAVPAFIAGCTMLNS